MSITNEELADDIAAQEAADAAADERERDRDHAATSGRRARNVGAEQALGSDVRSAEAAVEDARAGQALGLQVAGGEAAVGDVDPGQEPFLDVGGGDAAVLEVGAGQATVEDVGAGDRSVLDVTAPDRVLADPVRAVCRRRWRCRRVRRRGREAPDGFGVRTSRPSPTWPTLSRSQRLVKTALLIR